MSHIVQIQAQVKDFAAVRAACQRLGLPAPVQGTAKLFSGEASGLAVQLPDWVYPVVFDTAKGEARFDNFSGRWGDERHIQRFMKIYAAEKAKIEARRRGHSVAEHTLADGSIKLTIQVQGGVA
jgi:hypothetical protein